ncbi:hypothetical protein M3Y98_00125100 [Aphelenchoides besseyi]|nr:hypothetical protein M3Y98_00125100 [Aphelenchoides besseyi]
MSVQSKRPLQLPLALCTPNVVLRPFQRDGSRPPFFPTASSNAAETSRYAQLPSLSMNPNDSPRRSAYGGQMNETPHSSGGYNPGMMASPIVNRREFAPYPPPHAQQGKMLVDPQTGQQYFVPNVPSQTVHANPVAYYPVFYNGPMPQTAPQPLFYTASAPQHQSWNNAMPSPPVQSAHQSNFFTAHPYYPPNNYHQPVSNASSTPYHVEVPPSSAVSVCDEPNGSSPYFRRNHDGRLSSESTNSDRHIYAHSDDSMSPRVHLQQHPISSVQTPQLMETSARYSTASSSTTSGFASGTDHSKDVSPITRPVALRTAVQRPQLHGFPEWWGEETDEPKSQSDRTPTKSTTSASTPAVKPSASSQKLETPSPISESSRNAINVVVQKSIRMDFDLKTASIPESAKHDSKVSTPRVAPTAFTVNFDDSTEKPKRGKPSLSSEATNRRLARRSVPPSRNHRENAPTTQPNGPQDPKRYLLSKMLQGVSNAENNEADDGEEPQIGRDNNTKTEIDAISDAGTYVIEGKSKLRREAQRARTRDLDSQSSVCSSSSSSTATNPATQRSTTTSAQTTARSTLNSSRTSNSVAAKRREPTEYPHFAMGRSLMKDLRDLRAQNQPKPITESSTSASAPKARSVLESNKTNRLGVTPSARHIQQTSTIHSNRPATTSNSTGIRRADGGRFSMRTGNQVPSTATGSRNPNIKNPPFRAGIAPTKKGGNVESPEMVAWLRRKAYDPRKSAEEARKMQQLKARGESFFANRSISYNQPHNSGFNRLLRPIGDERSNKSTDDLSHFTEEVDDFSITGSNSNLNRAVDELTQKCQRSMQLLKLCNPNAMTESVEHLLDQMVDEQSEDGDDPMNRLQRLNDAFGALTKCLEDTTTSRTSSPRNTNISATLKQTILSPVSSAPPEFVTQNQRSESPQSADSPTSF